MVIMVLKDNVIKYLMATGKLFSIDASQVWCMIRMKFKPLTMLNSVFIILSISTAAHWDAAKVLLTIIGDQ